jgi:hypothetical protein
MPGRYLQKHYVLFNINREKTDIHDVERLMQKGKIFNKGDLCPLAQ